MKRLFAFILIMGASCAAQNWSGVLDPARAIDWTQAGAGAIPTNRTVCTTLNPGATTAQINSAIAACGANQKVHLNAGTYSGLSRIIFNAHNNVTLEGAGANATFLNFTSGGDCSGSGDNGAVICAMNADNNYSGDPHNTANWTAGYSKGATSITLSSTTNLHVGSLLILDQLDGTQSDPGDAIWVCTATSCSQQGLTGISGRANRAQQQQVTVTNISGTTVTITPGLYSPNWASGRTPGAWWSSSLPITGIGLENFSMNTSGVTNAYGAMIQFVNATNSWVKGIAAVQTVNGRGDQQHKHVWTYQSSHITVRDSYFYGSDPGSEGYGVNFGASSSDNLAENNIFQHIATGTINESSTGNVFGYNYAADNYYTGNGSDPAWQQCDAYHHSAGDSYILWEGHIGPCMNSDDIHGAAWMLTVFRSRFSGRDTTSKNEQTNAIHIYATDRYHNVVGNVLGTSGYHTNYSWEATSTGDSGNSSSSDVSIYSLSYSGNEGTRQGFNNDLRAASTLMRWGNYDTKNAAVRWVMGENASAVPTYPGLASPSQTLPASFYLSAKPAWWGSVAWPPIGPDVTGGNIANVGGHAYLTPAANCYLNVMGGSTTGSSGLLSFNPATCYSTGTVPPPTNLTGTVTLKGTVVIK